MANPAFVQGVTGPTANPYGGSVVVKTTSVAVGDTLIGVYMGYGPGTLTLGNPFPAGWSLIDTDT